MPSTFSPLKIQLMATGENNTTWGDVTNLNLGTALEEAIVGSADVTFASADVTLTLTDTNASQTARNMRLRCTGTTGGSTRNLIVPAIEKPYIVSNDCADSIIVKNTTGTGITVPAGKTMWVYNNATNVVDAVTHLSSLTLGTDLAVSDGGTGASTFTANGVIYGNTTSALLATAAGTTGQVLVGNTGAAPSWSTLSGIGVTSFSAGTTGLTPSTATTGAITLAGTLGVANGGTGTATAFTAGSVVFAGASGVYSQDNANFFWDDTNDRLGVGTTTPGASLDVNGEVRIYPASSPAQMRFGVGGVEKGKLSVDTSSNMAFETAGSERMRIDSSGNLLVGTTTASYSASGRGVAILGGSASGLLGFQIGGVAKGYVGHFDTSMQVWNEAASPILFGTSATERMRIDAAGVVGIGVTPSAWQTFDKNLQVGAAAVSNFQNGDNTFFGSNVYYGNSDFRYISSGNTANMYRMLSGEHIWSTAPSGTAGNAISFSERMRIDASGNVMVGTTATTSAFCVARGAGVAAAISLRGGNVAEASEFWVAQGSGGTEAYLYNRANGPMIFGTNNVERMRIVSGGQVLVGATATAGYFDGLLNVAGYACFKVSGSSATPVQIVWNNADSGDNEFISFYTNSSATFRGGINYNRAGGLVAYNTTSDYRAKDIIGPVTDTGATIDALKVYSGKMKGATIARPMLIAHEAQEVVPYAVTGEKDAVNEDGTDKYQQMDHQSFIPLLIAELQSLRARVAQLEGN